MLRPLTPFEIFERNRLDFPGYAGDCLRIRTKEGTIEPLILNAAQRHVHARIEEQKQRIGKVRVLGLKGRQQGFSTYVTGRYTAKVTSEFGKRAYILTHEQKATNNLFDMVSRYHELLPAPLKPHAGKASATELFFDRMDSGFLVGTAGAKATGRGGTYQYFHGSEVAFWDQAETHMAGVAQAVPDLPGTEMVLESTANGIGNLFHTKWQQALAGEGEYIAIFVPWFWQEEYLKTPPPGYQLDLEEAKYAEAHGLDLARMYWRHCKLFDDFSGDVALFNQEYPATPEDAFMAAGADTLIMPVDIALSRRSQLEIDRDAPVLMGVDVAEYGDDRSAIAVRKGRVALPIKRFSKKGLMEFTGIVANEIHAQKAQYVMVDTVGLGAGVADRLIELGFRNVIRVHSGETAIEDARFVNKRAEMWWEMGQWVKDRPNRLPDDDELQAELSGPSYGFDSSRRVRLESKELMKKRGLKSPDGGDALALTFAYKVATVKRTARRRHMNWRTM